MNTEKNFRAAMRGAGLDCTGPIEADGRLHRFKAEGDRERNSWYVLHPGPPMAGAFGCWKRNFKESWCDRSAKQLSRADWQAVKRRWVEAEQARERTETELQAKARKTAAFILARSGPPDGNAYLATKGVKPYGELRQSGGKLLVPLRNAERALHSLQIIHPDGSKTFLPGGRVAGCFFTFPGRLDGPVIVAEGLATAASIHEATGLSVLAAMNAGNLRAVAEAVRQKWTNREVILAADNDQWTDGNPGVTKATEAAKAVGGLVATPTFQDVSTRPTDYNDMHQQKGLETVREQIEAAAPPQETDEETFARLAALTPAEYDRCRKAEAERLNIRPGTLDDEVQARRPKPTAQAHGAGVDFPIIEPWEEAVSGSVLLDEIESTLRRFLIATDPAFLAGTLYSVFTFVFDWFDVCPLLFVTSPTKRCGKSRATSLLRRLAYRPLAVSSASAAGIYRVIELHHPCLIIDEVDTFLKGDEQLRGLINSGHTRDAAFHLGCVPKGDDFVPVRFSTWGPKILSGIGRIADTLEDRAVIVSMKRKRKQDQVERLRYRHEFEELRRKILRWTTDHEQALRDADPPVPHSLHDRAADNWTGLLAIADLAGGEWPTKARQASLELSGAEGQQTGYKVQLLVDIAAVFAEAGADKLSSQSLCDRLADMEGKPWAEFGDRKKPLTPNQLANILRDFGVTPDGVRIGNDTPRGYHLSQFEEPFSLYLPDIGFQGATPQQGLSTLNETHFSQGATKPNVAPCENAVSANAGAGCCTVALRKAEPGGQSVKTLGQGATVTEQSVMEL